MCMKRQNFCPVMEEMGVEENGNGKFAKFARLYDRSLKEGIEFCKNLISELCLETGEK